MNNESKINLFDADSLEYAGSIIINNGQWEYKDVKNENLVKMTSGMPIKAALACLISFNFVYDIIEKS